MKQIVYNNDKLSKLSLGTVQFGLDYGIANNNGQPTQNEVNEIVEYVYSNNINCFDTAQAYGTSELVLGEAIKTKKDLFVVSKLKSNLFINNLESNVNKSLSNLNIDCLYGLLLHDSQLLHTWNKEYGLLVDNLIKKNKIRYFGVSIYTDEDFELALKNDSIKLIQIPFNLLDQRAITKKWLKKAKDKNKLIFIRSIYLQGLILMDEDNIPAHLDGAKKYLKNINDIANRLNITKNELALSFVDQIADSSILLFGCDNLDQAIENINNYNNLPLLEEETIKLLSKNVLNIEEYIYNPLKWNSK